MAQYKVPQDVEADDKLIGPFSFRQFVYIMIAGGLIALCFLLWQFFPLLIILPIPFIVFFLILALPLKKDQPMETYLSAVIDFYTKPQKRVWMPGQTENSITITAPKIIEEKRTKDLSREEAGHRLSFLANIVDTEGYAIKESSLQDDVAAEAANATDMFDKTETYNLDRGLEQSAEERHRQIVEQMRSASESNHSFTPETAPTISHQIVPTSTMAPAPTPEPIPTSVQPVAVPVAPEPVTPTPPPLDFEPVNYSNVIVQPTPIPEPEAQPATTPEPIQVAPQPQPEPQPEPEPDEAAETIARLTEQDQPTNNNDTDEVYISLH